MSTSLSVSATEPRTASDAKRARIVSQYLTTVACIGRMVDQLGDLHAELPPDDRLQQVLHSLSLLWGYVETELHEAANRGKN